MSYERGVSEHVSVRLEPGSHRSPDDGVCVVELASMVGGEPFTDRPDCVDPVIASFLRAWNDGVGYADRQRIEPYASRVVGTGGYRRISRIRRDICLTYAGADLDHGPIRRAFARLRMRARIAWRVGVFPSIWLKEGAGALAAGVCFARGGCGEAFELLDRLLEVGPPAAPGLSLNGNGNGNGNGKGSRYREELGIRATIIARARPRSRGARASGSPRDAGGDSPRDRRAETPAGRS